MAKLERRKNSTSQILEIFIQDSSSTQGNGLTGLAYNTSNLTCYYHRNTASSAVQVSLVDMTVGAFTSNGFKQVDATNMPGIYQLCLPDAAYATGADSFSCILKGATNMVPVPIEVQLSNYDFNSNYFNANITHVSGTAIAPNVPGHLPVDVIYVSGAIAQDGDGIAQGGTSNTIIFDDLSSAVNDHYNGTEILLSDGQARYITDYVGSSRTATVNSNWISTPVSGSTIYYFVGQSSSNATLNTDNLSVNVSGWLGRAPLPLDSLGNVPAFVTGVVRSNLMYVTGIPIVNGDGVAQGGSSNTIIFDSNSDTVDDIYNGTELLLSDGQSRFVIDYVGSSRTATVHSNWVRNPVSGVTTYFFQGTSDGFVATSGITRNSFAGMSELNGVPTAPYNMADMTMWMFERSAHKSVTMSGVDTVYKSDNSTVLASGQLSDNGTAFTRAKYQ